MAKNSLPTPPSPSSEEDSSSDEEQPTTTKSAPQTPTPNKEEEESDDGSEEDSDEESGDEEDEDESNKPKPFDSAPSTKPASESGESESEDDDSDSDSEAAKLVTPISSKPMAGVPAEKEKANGKAHAFQRIWTLDDEIAILRGLVQFQSEKGLVKLNNSSISDFYNTIRKKLSREVTSSQLVEKLKRMRKNHLVIAARADGGKPPQFPKPHDGAVYELGKKIWAVDDESDGRLSNGVAADGGGRSLTERVGSLKGRFPFLKGGVESMGKRYAEEALERLDVTKAEALDKRLKRQTMAEMKHRVREVELWKETLKLVTDGMDRATE